jgi:hypothetical protein
MWHNGRHNAKSEFQGGLSWFLVAYLLMLLGVLLGVHLVQRGLERPAGATQLPAQPERATAMKQAVVEEAAIRR